MDHFADERDLHLLNGDKYTFFVLRRIIGGACQLLLTDHERLIICFTGQPYPVWIWTPDDVTEPEMEQAYQLAAANALLNGDHRFNVKYALAAYFIKRAAGDGRTLSVETNMFAYDCLNPVKPTGAADGALHRCAMEDLDALVDFMDMFHEELAIDRKNRDAYRADAECFIHAGDVYFWKDRYGRPVASCKFSPDKEMAAVNLVYTRPEYRRKHYAENLVYQVTRIAREAGCVPMLYTDADYVASNACYEKIGYVLRGKLCTVTSDAL